MDGWMDGWMDGYHSIKEDASDDFLVKYLHGYCRIILRKKS